MAFLVQLKNSSKRSNITNLFKPIYHYLSIEVWGIDELRPVLGSSNCYMNSVSTTNSADVVGSKLETVIIEFGYVFMFWKGNPRVSKARSWFIKQHSSK